MIRKEVFLTHVVFRECRRIVAESEVTLSDVLYFNIVAFYVWFLAKSVDILIVRFDLVYANINCLVRVWFRVLLGFQLFYKMRSLFNLNRIGLYDEN